MSALVGILGGAAGAFDEFDVVINGPLSNFIAAFSFSMP
jgi:hypothetical protein